MAEKTETPIKQLSTLIASVAALIMSIGSLIESCDKSVEKQSYETLSAKIVELQERETVTTVTPLEVIPMASVEAIASAEPPRAFRMSSEDGGDDDGSFDKSDDDKTVTGVIEVTVTPPPPSPKPPPKWEDVVSAAEAKK